MTVNKFEKSVECKRENVCVWFCDGCNFYHIKAGNIVLTFDSEEFSDFVNETWDCFYSNRESTFVLQ